MRLAMRNPSMNLRVPPALADATTLFRLMSERAVSTGALVAALDSVR